MPGTGGPKSTVWLHPNSEYVSRGYPGTVVMATRRIIATAAGHQCCLLCPGRQQWQHRCTVCGPVNSDARPSAMRTVSGGGGVATMAYRMVLDL